MFFALYDPNRDMDDHFYREKDADVQKGHNKRCDGCGNCVKGVADNEKPIKEVRISLRRSVIRVIANQCPRGHAKDDRQIPIACFEFKFIILVNQGQRAVNGHDAVKNQRLYHAIRERMHCVPHNARRIHEIDEIGNKAEQHKRPSVFCNETVVIAEEAQDTHGGTRVERQFFNVYLAVCQGHQKEVRYV